MSAELPLQFVDSNILIYAYDNSAGKKQSTAGNLLKSLWDHRNGCLSIQVLQEFYVSITQKVPRPLAPENALQILSDLGTWNVHIPQVNDVQNAMHIQQRYELSFWDAMILQSALQSGCQLLWSEDFSNNQVYEGVKVCNPFLI